MLVHPTHERRYSHHRPDPTFEMCVTPGGERCTSSDREGRRLTCYLNASQFRVLGGGATRGIDEVGRKGRSNCRSTRKKRALMMEWPFYPLALALYPPALALNTRVELPLGGFEYLAVTGFCVLAAATGVVLGRITTTAKWAPGLIGLLFVAGFYGAGPMAKAMRGDGVGHAHSLHRCGRLGGCCGSWHLVGAAGYPSVQCHNISA